jgi:hypothetical protein
MSRLFIIAMATGLAMLLAALLVWWFGFQTTEAPRVFLSLGYAGRNAMTGTFAAPVAFFLLNRGGFHVHRSKRNR